MTITPFSLLDAMFRRDQVCPGQILREPFGPNFNEKPRTPITEFPFAGFHAEETYALLNAIRDSHGYIERLLKVPELVA
jgi:hypothetical protein